MIPQDNLSPGGPPGRGHSSRLTSNQRIRNRFFEARPSFGAKVFHITLIRHGKCMRKDTNLKQFFLFRYQPVTSKFKVHRTFGKKPSEILYFQVGASKSLDYRSFPKYV